MIGRVMGWTFGVYGFGLYYGPYFGLGLFDFALMVSNNWFWVLSFQGWVFFSFLLLGFELGFGCFVCCLPWVLHMIIGGACACWNGVYRCLDLWVWVCLFGFE